MHFRHVYTRLLGSDIMSNWLSHKECPYEDCGSTDAFSYNTESCSGRCHSCERKYPRTKDKKFEWASETYPVMGQEQEKDDWDMNQQQTNIKPVPTEVLTPRAAKASVRYTNAVISLSFRCSFSLCSVVLKYLLILYSFL